MRLKLLIQIFNFILHLYGDHLDDDGYIVSGLVDACDKIFGIK